MCKKIYINLILVDETDRVEYTLLSCSRVPVGYLYDMYFLYLASEDEEQKYRSSGANEMITPVTSLRVPKIIDPNEWLTTGLTFPSIKAYSVSSDGFNKSLEVYLARPKKSKSYFAVGKDGTILLSSVNQMYTIQLYKETVLMITKDTSEYCHRPLMCRVNWGKDESCDKDIE